MARPKTKSCVLDGAALADAAAVYRPLGDVLGAPHYFGHNPDALWDAIGEYHGEPVEIVMPPVSVKSPADDDKAHPVNAAMLPVKVFRDDKGERAFETDVTTSGSKRRRIRFFR